MLWVDIQNLNSYNNKLKRLAFLQYNKKYNKNLQLKFVKSVIWNFL